MTPDAIPEVAAAQDIWFEEEIEQAKLCAQQVLIFTHHPWFLHDINEDEGEKKYWIIPKPVRERWFKKLRHAKVTASFAGHYHKNVTAWPFPKTKKSKSDAVSAEDIKIESDNESVKSDASEDDVDDYNEKEEKAVNPLEVGCQTGLLLCDVLCCAV
jgi:hypothetical protein